jgi:hypothetical protein
MGVGCIVSRLIGTSILSGILKASDRDMEWHNKSMSTWRHHASRWCGEQGVSILCHIIMASDKGSTSHRLTFPGHPHAACLGTSEMAAKRASEPHHPCRSFPISALASPAQPRLQGSTTLDEPVRAQDNPASHSQAGVRSCL